jgi:hypothetical protein
MFIHHTRDHHVVVVCCAYLWLDIGWQCACVSGLSGSPLIRPCIVCKPVVHARNTHTHTHTHTHTRTIRRHVRACVPLATRVTCFPVAKCTLRCEFCAAKIASTSNVQVSIQATERPSARKKCAARIWPVRCCIRVIAGFVTRPRSVVTQPVGLCIPTADQRDVRRKKSVCCGPAR